MTNIGVLVVDDSALVRRLVGDIVSNEPGMTLLGTAKNGQDAIGKIKQLEPDVMTLDLEMPIMGGLELLAHLRSERSRLPVIVLSSLTERGSAATLEALARGAADYVCKPTNTRGPDAPRTDLRSELIPRLRALGERRARSRGTQTARGQRPGSTKSAERDRTSSAPANAGRTGSARARLERNAAARSGAADRSGTDRAGASSVKRSGRTRSTDSANHEETGRPGRTRDGGSNQPDDAAGASPKRRSRTPLLAPRAVIIGSSTGGPAALENVFGRIKAPLNVPIFIVQHIPAEFSAMLAKRLDNASGMRVVEASDGQVAEAGTAYLAPGGKHMVLEKRKPDVIIRLTMTEPVNSCRPAVDVMFNSAAEVYAGRQLAVILTGMGRDGLEGCKTLVPLGVPVLAQDEESCVVWGMPRFVTELGLAEEVLPLDDVAGRIVARVTGRGVSTGLLRAAQSS